MTILKQVLCTQSELSPERNYGAMTTCYTLGCLKASPQNHGKASPIWCLDVCILVTSVLQQLRATEQHMILVSFD